jgi:hypothetical protein
MQKLIISDNINGFLSFDLRDLLHLISKGENYQWVMKEMDFNILSDNENSISNLEFSTIEKIENSSKYIISWNELQNISTLKIQIVNGEIIGSNNQDFISLKAVDSSYWIVESNIQEFLEGVGKKFKSVST